MARRKVTQKEIRRLREGNKRRAKKAKVKAVDRALRNRIKTFSGPVGDIATIRLAQREINRLPGQTIGKIADAAFRAFKRARRKRRKR